MPIKVLPLQISTKIAAGEVVDCPGSVVKEVVENSLDAGASRIDIDIERGGKKLICINDNGCGIKKEELTLALKRHATSKIASLDDLESIISLGFRGEALASISSVSRLTLTSRTAEQNEGWQTYTEGCDIKTVKPAAHPIGTTLQVLDLFYNSPVRRKFMRTDKTEFCHIDDIIRRIALARFDVTINLKHNGKIIRQYRSLTQSKERRLAAICGTAFMDKVLEIQWQHEDLTLYGWIAYEKYSTNKKLSDIQYYYVNGRIVRNRLINHAIRHASEQFFGSDIKKYSFVIYLNLAPNKVDVNVHPAKHEVRFHQPRLVHDFIYQGILSTLQHNYVSKQWLIPKVSEGKPLTILENRPAAGRNKFTDIETEQVTNFNIKLENMQLPTTDIQALECKNNNSFGRVLTIIAHNVALLECDGKLALLALTVAENLLNQSILLKTKVDEDNVHVQPLIIPIKFKISQFETHILQQAQSLLMEIGIELILEMQDVTILAVPFPLRKQNLQQLITELISYLAQHPIFDVAYIVKWICSNKSMASYTWSMRHAINMLAKIESIFPELVKYPPGSLLQPLDFTLAMKALKYE